MWRSLAITYFLVTIAHTLWPLAYGLLGVKWVKASTLKDELWAWIGLTKQKKCLGLILVAIFWVLWKESKRRVF